MNDNTRKILNNFGEKLIESARDKTIRESIKTIKGEIKDKISLQIAEKLKGIESQEMEAIENLIIDSIDGALNNFLWMIERDDIYDLVADMDSKKFSLKKLSDGLSVDYWNFVDDFSHYKRVDS
ncbi:MAG TPA: hypothetical protein VMW10_10750 [Alphaproteobacteria bacterium]|nr:hypothetical protein [Alphaproteobacteria bacterium]